MARKPRRQPRPADQKPIPERSSVLRPAAMIALGVVMLLLGVTGGIVFDVSTRPSAPPPVPAQPKPVQTVRPDPNVPPPRIEAPRAPSIFDADPAPDTADDIRSGLTPLAMHAIESDAPDDWPVIAIVIDDMGIDRARSEKVLELPGPLTVSFLTYADDLTAQAKRARDAGHEVMAHIPMEPLGSADPGPGALLLDEDPENLRGQMAAYLDDWSGYVGINNHMGSKLTADREAMSVVMSELRARGLMWLDSRTDANTVGEALAAEYGVPHLGRDVFLDNEDDIDAILGQLAKVEAIARQQGFAVAIGHPRDFTTAALKRWLPTLGGKGIAIAPVSEVLNRRAEQ
jgi:polysaccharide deacetylase 2 family uncharacterized protein YibQ